MPKEFAQSLAGRADVAVVHLMRNLGHQRALAIGLAYISDKIDSDGLIKVAKVLQEAVQYLAERREPLHSTLGGNETGTAVSPAARRVSFGTVPDFTWSGDGVRLDDVRADTPAALAGLRKGDIISAVNDTPVHDMRGYGQALRLLNPGDKITVRFQRDGTEQTITTQVTER